LYKAITIILAFIALATLVTTTTTQVVRAEVSQPTQPTEDGSCAGGEHQTRVGCCPDGTTNVHNFCDTQEHHSQETTKGALGALCEVAGMMTGHLVRTVTGVVCQ